MKKLLAILLSLGLSCSLLTSCSKDDKSSDKEETKQEETKKEDKKEKKAKDSEDTDTEEEEEAEADDEEEESEKKTIKKETEKVDAVLKDETELEKYLKDNKSDVEALEDSFTVDGMDLKISADGNSMVFKFTTDAFSDIDVTDEVIDAMTESMEEQEETFGAALEMFKTEIPSIESLVIEIYTQDGELIYDTEIK